MQDNETKTSLDNKRIKVCINCNINKDITEFWKKKKLASWVDNVCKECNKIYSREYYNNNKEKVLNRTKKYYEEHKFEFKEYYKIYAPIYRSSEIWRNKKRIIDHNRRIKLLKKENDWTINEASCNILIEKQNYKCGYCEKEIIDNKSRHLDHIIPLSKGWVHTIDNVHWTCKNCNLRKNTKSHEEFLTIIKW